MSGYIGKETPDGYVVDAEVPGEIARPAAVKINRKSSRSLG